MANVAYYKYGLDTFPPTDVVNTTPSGTAQAQVSLTPATGGSHTLYVQSVDGSGNTSGTSSYPFAVGDSGITNEQATAMKEQARFVQAADKITDVVDTTNPSGYTSVELSDGAVTVWWKGAVPSNVQQAIDDARAIAPVVVSQAAYSKAELVAREDQLSSEMEQDPNSNILSLAIAVDGSKIIMGTSDVTG